MGYNVIQQPGPANWNLFLGPGAMIHDCVIERRIRLAFSSCTSIARISGVRNAAAM